MVLLEYDQWAYEIALVGNIYGRSSAEWWKTMVKSSSSFLFLLKRSIVFCQNPRKSSFPSLSESLPNSWHYYHCAFRLPSINLPNSSSWNKQNAKVIGDRFEPKWLMISSYKWNVQIFTCVCIHLRPHIYFTVRRCWRTWSSTSVLNIRLLTEYCDSYSNWKEK